MGPRSGYPLPGAQTNLMAGPPPEFGHAMHKCFGFDPHYTNLNHGSYGCLPLPVRAACDDLTSQIESNPDLFIRRRYQPLLREVRERLADLIGAAPDECVLVPDASHGLSTVLQNFVWNQGDILIQTSVPCNAASRTSRLQANLTHPSVSFFELRFPTSPQDIISKFSSHIRSLGHGAAASQKIVAVIDSFAGLPGVLIPWKELVQICRDAGVWTVVNAGHSIGQEVGVNLREVQPDFWISNCHKWLFAKRSCAVVYIPKRNHHSKFTFPTSYAHFSIPDNHLADANSFLEQYEWSVTVDIVTYLSILTALDFRNWLGGEARINRYCRSLAMAGGRRLAWILGTRIMDESGQMTANMVNVELPLPENIPWSTEVDQVFSEKLLDEWNVYAAHFHHNGRWWVRCSVQVWNEMRDFLVLGLALVSVCNEVKERVNGGGGTVPPPRAKL